MSLRPNERIEARKKVDYKASFDRDGARRKREETIVEIRKKKREEGLLKKRREGMNPAQFMIAKIEILPSLVSAIEDETTEYEAAMQIRKLLSTLNPPIGEVIESGVVPRLVDFLKREDRPDLQFEAAWALTNIASGTSAHTSVLINHGAVPQFINLLSSSNEIVREQAVWALGNVAGDSASCRDIVLSCGAMTNLLPLFNQNVGLSTLRNATWTLSNFCRGKPPPIAEEAKAALSVLVRVLQIDDEQILTDACCGLSYLADRDLDSIQQIIEAGVGPRLVELLMEPSSALQFALRTIGNIVTGNDTQTQYIVSVGALPCLLNLLVNDHKTSITREACWTISNILAGNQDQIQAVIDTNIIPALVWLLQNAVFDIRREAAWAISNIAMCGNKEHIQYIVSQGCIKPLCDLLTCHDLRIIEVCLETLENILRVGSDGGRTNQYASLLEDAGGLDNLEFLQEHENHNIYLKAIGIVDKYLADYDPDEDPLFPNADANNDSFTSQAPSIPPGGFNFD